MSLVQAILIGCVCALTQLEGDWLGECKLREPVITGFLVGLIMGDVAKGLFFGGSLQLMLMHTADAAIDQGNEKKLIGIHFLCGFFTFLIYFSFTFIVLYVGSGIIDAIVAGIPEWAQNGLSAVAVALPAMGFALLLNILWDVKLIPYFIIGFALAAYLGVDMVGVCAISVAIALIIYEIKVNQLKSAPVVEKVEDEWEDD